MSRWVRGLRRITSVAAISWMALAASLVAAHAQSFNITNLTQNTASKASFPSMVTDSQGNLNLAWIDSDSKKGLQFARSSSSASGTSFGTPPVGKTITGPDGITPVFPSFQPQLAVYPTQENVIEITWASPDATSTPAAPLYDIWAARSNDGGANFATTTTMIAGPVALFDGPRLAFDSTGKTDIVWGRNNVWISQAQDGLSFNTGTPPTPLMPPGTPIDTGGPRIAVTSAGHIFVMWTDEANKSAQNSYCIPGTPSTTTVGGNFWINETLPTQPPTPPNVSNTRNLSNSDWASPNRSAGDIQRFPVGFFGCSYDNLSLYLDKVGLLHLLWSDDSPGEDVLSSRTITTYPMGSPFAGLTEFSFPINLASVPAAAPQVTVDTTGNIYVVWSGGPTGGTGATPGSTNSQGIFFSRADAATPYTDTGNSFTTAINIAPKAIAPAFPQIAVDSNSNVNIAWEQPTATLKGDGTDVFNVFFARSTDKGNTFPTVLPVTTSPSTLCFAPAPPPAGDGSAPTTPDFSTCGTVQLGVDANSIPDMVWVNQASGSAVADIDFATTNFPTGSVSPTTVNLSATNKTANVTITVSQNGFSGPVNFSCFDVDTNSSTLPSWLTCTFNPPSLNTAQSTTDTLTFTRQGTPTTSMFISGPSSHVLPGYGRPMAWSMALAAFCLISMTILWVGRRRELSAAVVMRGLLVMTLTLALAAGMVSCGGSTSSPSTTSTTGTSGSSGSGGTGGSGGSGGTGGSGGGTMVTVHVAVMAQSGSSAAVNLGTVTVNAQ